MGQIETQENYTPEKVTKNQFDFKYIIGRGGFGKVWKVSYKKTGSVYALKEMSKVKIIDKKSEKSVMSERSLLARLHHPFLVNMVYSFQDSDYLYLVMDYLTGGDLRYHLCHRKMFTEEQTKFFMACIILGLEYIHSNNIIHRDIKPENLVCDDKGYIRITDFGVAKKYDKNNGDETSGTPGYMAPEVLCAKNHSYPVDFFALGVIGYEFMIGERPYLGRGRKEIKQAVLAKQVQLKASDVPLGWSLEAADLINKLIQRKVSNRIGTKGIEEIKTHPWFCGFSWSDLYEKKMNSPFIPQIGDNFDRKYCESEEKIGSETIDRYRIYKKNDNYEQAFRNYTYNNLSKEEMRRLSSMSSSVISTGISSKKTTTSLREITRELLKQSSSIHLKKIEKPKKLKIKLKNISDKDLSYQQLKLPKGVLSPSYNKPILELKDSQLLPRIDTNLKRSSSTFNMMNYNKKTPRHRNRVFPVNNGVLSPPVKYGNLSRKLSISNSNSDLYNTSNNNRNIKLKRSESTLNFKIHFKSNE